MSEQLQYEFSERQATPFEDGANVGFHEARHNLYSLEQGRALAETARVAEAAAQLAREQRPPTKPEIVARMGQCSVMARTAELTQSDFELAA